MNLWRISNYRNLDGEGGRLFSARWTTAGKPVVYLADSPSSALLEVLVHLQIEDDEIPRSFTLLTVQAPDQLTIMPLHPSGDDWIAHPESTRRIGDAWLAAGRSALACVPSAILPRTTNFLLNPLHPDATRVKIIEAESIPFDPRLLSRQTSPHA